MEIRIFNFNPLQVNTFVLYDETGEAVVIDPGMSSEQENAELEDFIARQNLSVKYILNTHPHVDHVLGNNACKLKFGAPLVAHAEGMKVYERAYAYCIAFGIPVAQDLFPNPDQFVTDGDTITFGNQSLLVLETPGHCAGSISLYSAADKAVFVGDVLFENSVGRSDLPTGDPNELLESIRAKLLSLPDDTTVYPGHGAATTIGNERRFNAFLI